MCGQTPIDSIQYMETYSMGLCYAKDGINIRWYEYFNSTTKFDQSRNRDMRPVLCFSLWHNISRTRKFIQKVLFQFCSTCNHSCPLCQPSNDGSAWSAVPDVRTFGAKLKCWHLSKNFLVKKAYFWLYILYYKLELCKFNGRF